MRTNSEDQHLHKDKILQQSVIKYPGEQEDLLAHGLFLKIKLR